MKSIFKHTVLAGAIIASFSCLAATEKPNLVTILLDDSGFSDLGVFGGEVNTPNLDKLAMEGVRFANFYAAPTSSPTRAMLFTGRDAHKVGLGNMAELMRKEQQGLEGYEGYLTKKFPTYAELLKEKGGYQNYLVGKWHMGAKPGYRPLERGFDKAYGIHGGAGNFYQNADGTPSTVWHGELYSKLGAPATDYFENGEPILTFPKDFYSTNYFGDKAIEYLKSRDASKPFHLYLSFNAPHWPLQAPQDVVDKYIKTYEKGWDQVRKDRFERLKKLGFIEKNAKLPTVWDDIEKWNSLSAGQQRMEAKKMAVYAAMVDVLDQNVGKLLDYMKQTDIYNDTVFMVMSDNGASYKDPYTDKHFVIFSKDWIADLEKRFTNSYENLGSRDSYFGYTKGWASASNMPYSRFKETMFEGGAHVMAFATYPGKTQGGKILKEVYSVLDIAPTILDLAKISDPLEFKGEKLAPMQGSPFTNVLLGGKEKQKPRTLGWEMNGMLAVRDGNYRLSTTQFDPHYYVYDLKKDPFEQSDIGDNQPNIKKALLEKYEKYAKENGVVSVGVQPKPVD